MTSSSRWVRRRRLLVFFALAFVFAWITLPLAVFGVMEQVEFQPYGPLLAALIVVPLTEGMAGVRRFGARLVRWRVGALLWAFALVIPVSVHLVVLAINSGFGGEAVNLTELSWSGLLGAFALRLVLPLDGPFGEEPGWRGYAVPELQRRRSPLQAAAILGAIVAVWHAPLLFGNGSLDSAVELATTFVITFVYVWLFNRTGGSVLLVLVFHSAEGIVQESAFGAAGAELVRMAWISLALWTAVALSVIVFDRGAWRKPVDSSAAGERSAPVVSAGAAS